MGMRHDRATRRDQCREAPLEASARRGTKVAASDERLTSEDILSWLAESYEPSLELLWALADIVRQSYVGNAIHVRALLEVSSHGAAHCAFCGPIARGQEAPSHRMNQDEMVESARVAAELRFGTVVLQAGDDQGLTTECIAGAVRRIKSETPLAVTLSLGDRSERELEAWREAGADRYFLCFETFDRELLARIHPSASGPAPDPITSVRRLKKLGYETGSGSLVGIPGQTYQSAARDIEIFRELDLDMIVVGPFISAPGTLRGEGDAEGDEGLQVPATDAMVYKVLALARLTCPEANLFSTTTLTTVHRTYGRGLGLARGANVLVHDITPPRFRSRSAGNGCPHDEAQECAECLRARIHNMGRSLAIGPGSRERE